MMSGRQRAFVSHSSTSRLTGKAFLAEALLILLFVVCSVAIISQMFAASSERARQSYNLSNAIELATSAAEEFSCSPESVNEEFSAKGLLVSRSVESVTLEAGVMYKAHISVSDPNTGSQVYSLDTSRYVSGVS